MCYVPGNHDLWVRGSSPVAPSSFHKLDEIMTCALDCGITISPLRIISTLHQSLLTICPLYSWYHSSFDTEPELTHPLYVKYEKLRNSQKASLDNQWVDFRQCKWSKSVLESHYPEEIAKGQFVFDNSDNLVLSSREDNTIVPRWFSELNDPYLNRKHNLEEEDSSLVNDVITFSHFLPRVEVLLEKGYLLEPQLPKVCGSTFLENQIRSLNSNLHIVRSLLAY